jgi:transcriptional regulator with XRE-family HTH domain
MVAQPQHMAIARGERIRVLRRLRELPVREVAGAAGVSESTVLLVEKGYRSTEATIKKIEAVLGIDPEGGQDG